MRAKNKIWVLRRLTDKGGEWDVTNGFVVVAPSEKAARVTCTTVNPPGDEGNDTWLDAKLSSCRVIPTGGPSRIVLRDFNAG